MEKYEKILQQVGTIWNSYQENKIKYSIAANYSKLE